MVDANRAKNKLPSLIVGNCSNRKKENWSAYKRMEYRINQFKKKNPEKYATLTHEYLTILAKIENAANGTGQRNDLESH